MWEFNFILNLGTVWERERDGMVVDNCLVRECPPELMILGKSF